jgi:hypothetical protein
MDQKNRAMTGAEAFLQRAERQRLESECLRPLDLRQHAEGPCKQFSYRGRSLWLDATAQRLFLEGLNRNAGVFTVETYESILAHFQAASSELDTHSSQETLPTATPQSLSTDFSIEPERLAHNLVFDLSYFEKRVYDRLKLTLNMRLLWKGEALAAETRDLSMSGLQLRVKLPLEVREGDRLYVDVSPCCEQKLEQPALYYRVVRIRRLLQETLVALQCIETEPKDGLKVIDEYVAQLKQAALDDQQADPEDALLTAQALLAERFYMRSTTLLPFFVFKKRAAGAPLRIIFGNQVNRQALQAFETTSGQYDFSSLVTRKRLKLLKRLALRNSKADTLIAVYRTSWEQSPQVVADLDCKNHKHWRRLLMQHAEEPDFRVFKVVARLARRPVAMRIEEAVRPLAEQDSDLGYKLLLDANALSIVGAMVDVTEMVRGWRPSGLHPQRYAGQPLLQCREDNDILPPPQLIPVRYIQENRSEPRFLKQMRVEMQIAGEFFTGQTQDLSAHGLSVVLHTPRLDLEGGEAVLITLPELESQSTGLARLQGTFREVPATVVGVGSKQPSERRLQLTISDLPAGRRFASAFSNYLAQSQAELQLDSSHAQRAVTSRLYSSIFIESAATLPVFIYRSTDQHWTYRLGLVTSPCPLTDFFEVSDAEYDFSVLGQQGRLEQLMQRVDAQGSGELMLYLYKQRRRDEPSFEIHSLADFEITDEGQRRAFVQRALEHDFHCVKLAASHPEVPPQVEIEQAIDRLMQLSPGKSERLKEDFNQLIAIGDLVDVTGLVEDIWSEADPAVR